MGPTAKPRLKCVGSSAHDRDKGVVWCGWVVGGCVVLKVYKINVYSCVVQVSWIRLSDVSLLAVGGYTYTSDLRLEAEREEAGGEEGSSSWALVIRNVSTGDAGQYECQVELQAIKRRSWRRSLLGPSPG